MTDEAAAPVAAASVTAPPGSGSNYGRSSAASPPRLDSDSRRDADASVLSVPSQGDPDTFHTQSTAYDFSGVFDTDEPFHLLSLGPPYLARAARTGSA